jgi:hypothetical protein
MEEDPDADLAHYGQTKLAMRDVERSGQNWRIVNEMQE